MNQTTHYQLNQWEAADRILMADFNADNAKLDAALKAQSDAITAKAAQSTVTALTQTVAGKAEASALTAETAARQAADEALAEKAGYQAIKTVTLQAEANEITLDLSDVEWDQWATVRILCKPASSNTYRVKGNDLNNFTLGYERYGPFQVILYPFFDQHMEVCGHYWPPADEDGYVTRYLDFADFTSLVFTAEEGLFQAGTVVKVLGEK